MKLICLTSSVQHSMLLRSYSLAELIPLANTEEKLFISCLWCRNVKAFVLKTWVSLKFPERCGLFFFFKDEGLKNFLFSLFQPVTIILNKRAPIKKRAIERVRTLLCQGYDALSLIWDICWVMFCMVKYHPLTYPYEQVLWKGHMGERDCFMIIDERKVAYLKNILLSNKYLCTKYNLKLISNNITSVCYFFILMPLRMMTFQPHTRKKK